MVTCRRAEHGSRLLDRPADAAPVDVLAAPPAWWRRVAVPGQRPRALLELMVIAAMFGAYKLGRIVAAKHVGTAFDNAYVVWDLERILRLPDELSVQALLLKSTLVIKSANVYYVAVHFPATAAFLVWLYLRRPADYLWVRRTLALTTASGLLVHLAIPVAPPRMLGPLGFVDTADVYGPAVYGPPAQNSLADQYAAMPSLHIGWAIMVAIGIIATTRTRWRWLAVAHPVITTLVVIGTANHFWLDGMVAASLLAVSLVVVRSYSDLHELRIEVPDFVPVLDRPSEVTRAAADRAAAHRTAADRMSADAERAAADRLTVERLTVERLTVERLTVERLAADRLTVERLAAEGVVADRAAVDLLGTDGPETAGPPDTARLLERMPPPVPAVLLGGPATVRRPHGQLRSGTGAEDLADVAGDRGDG